jgi:hypothetical protein
VLFIDGMAPRLCSGLREERSEKLERALHGTGGKQQLGDEELLGLEASPHLVHGGNHVLLDQFLRILPLVDRLLRDRNGAVAVASHDRITELAQVRHLVSILFR